MSLKTFHIVFVTVSFLLSLGFAAWCMARFSTEGSRMYAGAAVLSLAAGGGLLFYGRAFLRKLKDVDFF